MKQKIRNGDAMVRAEIVIKNTTDGTITKHTPPLYIEFWMKNGEIHPSDKKPVRLIAVKGKGDEEVVAHIWDKNLPWVKSQLRIALEGGNK